MSCQSYPIWMEGKTAEGSDPLSNETVMVTDVTQRVSVNVQHFDTLIG